MSTHKHHPNENHRGNFNSNMTNGRNGNVPQGCDTSLNLEGRRLSSFNESYLPAHMVARNAVTTLLANNNSLVTFDGIENVPNLISLSVNENSFRSICFRGGKQSSSRDSGGILSLAKCYKLRLLSVKENNISLVDFTIPPAHINNGPPFVNIRVLDLSHNVLDEVPNVSALVGLEELYLGHNRITSLIGFTQCAPSSPEGTTSLRRLELNNNDITNWIELRELTSCSVSITELTIAENPWDPVPDFDLRSFVCFLMPLLEKLNGIAVSDEEEYVASQIIPDLSVLDHDADLVAHLSSFCHKPLHCPFKSIEGGRVSSSLSRMSALSQRNRREEGRDKVLTVMQMKIDRIEQIVDRFASQNNMPASKQATPSECLPEMQRLDAAVRGLWKEFKFFCEKYDTDRYVSAARTLQRAWRGYIARHELKRLRAEYTTFLQASGYLAAAVVIQRNVRRWIQKRRLSSRMHELAEKVTLRRSVTKLTNELCDVQALVFVLNDQLEKQQSQIDKLIRLTSTAASRSPSSHETPILHRCNSALRPSKDDLVRSPPGMSPAVPGEHIDPISVHRAVPSTTPGEGEKAWRRHAAALRVARRGGQHSVTPEEESLQGIAQTRDPRCDDTNEIESEMKTVS